MSKERKIKKWELKDYARTIFWFIFHTVIFILGFMAILYVNANFDLKILGAYLKIEGTVKNLIYLVIAMLLVSLGIYLYFYHENNAFIKESKNINLVFIILEVCIAIMFIVGKYMVMVYARPFALCALLSLLLIEKRTAIFMNTVSCFLMFMIDAFLAINPMEGHMLYSSLLIGFSTSILAIYLVAGISSRLKVFLMGFLISLPIILCTVCLEFSALLTNPVPLIIAGFTSGMLSVVLMMAILPLLEKIFSRVTVYKLYELTDHKAPLLQRLNKEAPGTFNHCLVVSTLAESCASAIGEDPLLARACAYYHDIGKIVHPEYFTENQSGYNPHNEITPELSVDIIRSHATDGAKIIKDYKLPTILSDVAEQHHGTLHIRYFYMQASKFSEETLPLKDFAYKGPRPQTKIAAILMLADACEAKVRSLPMRSHEKVDEAVREIIEERMDFDQFFECDITMRDLDVIRKTLTNSLAGVHHDRVEYPKLKIGGNKYE
ncbi:MAG: HDIG domain-containing protein [Clostridia bacterium]|nr:HDIG domain-containing protein [Clostridia bacterium]